MNIKQQTIQQIESGKIFPTIETMNEITNYFCISFEELLLTGRGSMLRESEAHAHIINHQQTGIKTNVCPLCGEKERLIQAQEKTISSQEKAILSQEETIHALKGDIFLTPLPKAKTPKTTASKRPQPL